MVRGIAEGQLDISDVMPQKIVNEVARVMKESPGSISEIQQARNGKYSYGELRMVQAHLHRKGSE